MKFTTSYSPVTMKFASMTEAELSDFYNWFIVNLPYFLDELIQAVWKTPGFEGWSADFSPESLDMLGEWFAARVESRDLSPEEIDELKSEITSAVEIATWELTSETKSLAVFIGMYYGQVAIKNNPKLSWKQVKANMKLADFGQPVISGPGVVPINPVRVANVLACGIARGSKTGSRLRGSYDNWSKLVVPKGSVNKL
ncbi:hypothetical protein QN366_21890 [Pseudomonas sp. CCC3.2]|uniref:hypothetical protein n=1 Tax=unclassified Pseudomonas TaxID=196821 RepID=UPI002AB5B12B|nr:MULTISPECIES: hypothetical protein [unclassified Pseudomonas]MDY7560890.1 hypothetical protein [Pseudomonas sp. AB6]MEB0182694.1 hypothetical protein [Pseudomonas sp. CCC3.2]MEB0213276.1 hypothetical protein [Pseudomonas sp. AB6]